MSSASPVAESSDTYALPSIRRPEPHIAAKSRVRRCQKAPKLEWIDRRLHRVEVVVATLLFIVSRQAPGRYSYLKHVFAGESGEVIVDRRAEERRQRQSSATTERRHVDRRHRDITPELRSSGWALVRHPAE